jgi:serpin B
MATLIGVTIRTLGRKRMTTLSRRRFLAGVGLTALAGLLMSCGASPNAVAEARSSKPRLRNPQAPTDDVQAYTAGHNAFGLMLYNQLRNNDGNLFFSPYSVAQALTMISAGARGDTAQQMAQTLHSAFPQARLHPAANALDLALSSRGAGQEGFRLEIANSIWGQRDYAFQPEFLDLLATNYSAGLRLQDFKTAPEPARAAINAAIAEQTQDKIKELLPPGSIDGLTRMVLANAIYFNAKWVAPFPKENTEDGAFHLEDGGTLTAPLMRLRKILRYTEKPEYQAVALPYKGGVSMIVLLPRTGELAAFEQQLSAERFQAILGELAESDLILMLPKFAYQSDSVSLRQALTLLGMADAFIPNTADFSGMDGTRDLYLSDVYHRGMVRVDEEGTEAAAATAGVIEAVSAPPMMIVDRPFIFAIRDDETGALLFMGRVVNPKAAG